MITTTMSNGAPVATLSINLGTLRQRARMDDEIIDELRYNFDGLGYIEYGGGERLTKEEQRELAADVIDDVLSYLARKNPGLFRLDEL